MNLLAASSEVRKGDKKYRIWYHSGEDRDQLSPVTLQRVRQELRHDNEDITDVEVLPLGFLAVCRRAALSRSIGDTLQA